MGREYVGIVKLPSHDFAQRTAGAWQRIEKACAAAADAKKNVTIAVNAAHSRSYGRLLCSKAAQGDRVIKKPNVQNCRLRCKRSKIGLSIRGAVAGHGHTNCSPERPKQNFLPTLTS